MTALFSKRRILFRKMRNWVVEMTKLFKKSFLMHQNQLRKRKIRRKINEIRYFTQLF